jgi:uncharacterized phage-associated protein
MPKIYRAEEIARYFLAKTDAGVGDLISNLKLQKLCYYSQGIGLVARHQPIFEEPLEAWLHGPVVPVLYRQYKENGSNAIPPITDLDIGAYDAADRMVFDDVYEYYGQYSAWRLRRTTHEEPPWREAFAEGANHTIDLDSL